MQCVNCNSSHAKGYLFETGNNLGCYSFVCDNCIPDYIDSNAYNYIEYFNKAFVVGDCIAGIYIVDKLLLGEEFTVISFPVWCAYNKEKFMRAVLHHLAIRIKEDK